MIHFRGLVYRINNSQWLTGCKGEVKEIMDDRGNKEHLIECLKVAALNIYNIQKLLLIN